jgi:hypothetical protein
MLPEDRNEFFRFAQDHNPVVITTRDSDSSEVQPADPNVGHNKTLCLWNPKFLPHLERTWIPDPGYYRVESLKAPILEFAPSFTAKWEGKPALGQGRLFGNFEPYLGKPQAFERWYESLVRWIRQNYEKSPASAGGYVGHAAYEFYKSGGYLLPNILPPRTKEWLAEIGKQHSQSSTSRQVRRHTRTRS